MTASLSTLSSVASVSSIKNQRCFHLKASFAPCAILQILHYDLTVLNEQLTETIQKAPNFFKSSPLIIDLEKIGENEPIQFHELKQIIVRHGLVPIGIRSTHEAHLRGAAEYGLSSLTVGKFGLTEAAAPEVKVDKSKGIQTKLITTPIRSGMQVYSKESDLIVMSAVSAGAELFSDGHIHVYGPLRGRALAGVLGNRQARIFCTTLEAELVSIAGFYLTKEDIKIPESNEGMIQIYLEDERVRIEAIK